MVVVPKMSFVLYSSAASILMFQSRSKLKIRREVAPRRDSKKNDVCVEWFWNQDWEVLKFNLDVFLVLIFHD